MAPVALQEQHAGGRLRDRASQPRRTKPLPLPLTNRTRGPPGYGGYYKDKWLPRARVVWWQRYAANNFTFITVKGGRHEVPETAPEQALELVRRLVSGESF